MPLGICAPTGDPRTWVGSPLASSGCCNCGRRPKCMPTPHAPTHASPVAKLWTHWDLSPGPSACEADVMPLHHVPHVGPMDFFHHLLTQSLVFRIVPVVPGAVTCNCVWVSDGICLLFSCGAGQAGPLTQCMPAECVHVRARVFELTCARPGVYLHHSAYPPSISLSGCGLHVQRGGALCALSHVRAAAPVFSINVDVDVVVILVIVCASRRSAMAPCRASMPRSHGGQGGPRGRAAAGTVYDVISWCVCVACRWASARSRATRAKGAPHSQAQDAATVVAGPKTCPSCVQPPTRRQ